MIWSLILLQKLLGPKKCAKFIVYIMQTKFFGNVKFHFCKISSS